METSRISLQPDTLLNRVAVRGMQAAGLLTQPLDHSLFYRMTREIARLVDPRTLCTARVTEDSLFRFFLADPYWNMLVSPRYRYEPELTKILQRTRHLDYAFLDLGANFGFWSVLISSRSFGRRVSVAVEPVTTTYRMLLQNWSLNDERFSVRNAAIGRESGQEIWMQLESKSYSHPGAFGVVASDAAPSENRQRATTISIDDLCSEEGLSGGNLVIKLDVEGMGIEALKGAERTLKSDFLLIFEDHASDPTSALSDFVLGQGYEVHYYDRGSFRRITTLEQINRIKTQKWRGYNIIACPKGGSFAPIFEEP